MSNAQVIEMELMAIDIIYGFADFSFYCCCSTQSKSIWPLVAGSRIFVFRSVRFMRTKGGKEVEPLS